MNHNNDEGPGAMYCAAWVAFWVLIIVFMIWWRGR